MKNIINEAKAEVKAQKQAEKLANKKPMTIKVTTLALVVVTLILGFIAGTSYQNYQNNTIKTQVTEQVKSLK